MMASETTNSRALPVIIGRNASSPCTSVMSMIERLTTWPVLQLVLARTVEAVEGAEDVVAQVVLHVEGEPAGQVPADEAEGEAREPGADEHEHPGKQRLSALEHSLVDHESLDQRNSRLHRHPGEGGTEREQHRAAIPPAIGGKAAQPPPCWSPSGRFRHYLSS